MQDWAAAYLQSKRHLSYKTVMRVLRDKNIVKWNNSEGYGRKKVWCVTNSVFEEELWLWVVQIWDGGVFLNNNLIQEKSRRLQCTLNESLPPHEQSNMQFRNFWLHSFKQHHNFKRYKSQWKQDEADNKWESSALPRLRQLAAQYSLVDILNADKFGLCYSATPKSITASGRLPACKINKY